MIIRDRTGTGGEVTTQFRGILQSLMAPTETISGLIGQMGFISGQAMLEQMGLQGSINAIVQAAQARGAAVRWIDLDPETTELDLASAERVIGERTRVVAVTAASNLLGTKPPVRRIARLAHRAGALLYVDGVHYAAHALVDVEELGADMFVCSPYKFLGPHCGVVAADPAVLEDLRIDKLAPATDDVPERFEFGTLPYELMAGTTAAIDFLASLSGERDETSHRRERVVAGFEALHAHEQRLQARLEAVENAVAHGRMPARAAALDLIAASGREEI